MKFPVDIDVSRRDLIQGGLLLGAAAFLAGCQTTGSSASALPGPVWPDQEKPVFSPRPSAPSNPVPSTGGRTIAVIPRSQWVSGRAMRRAESKKLNGVDKITVHHDAINSVGLRGTRAIASRLRSIRNSHMDRGPEWVDIGYHYVIDPEGRVWEGRPIDLEGAHVAKTNPHNLGIMVMGNFNSQRPTQAQVNTLDAFLAQQVRKYRLSTRSVYTHQELKSTECPGNYLQQYMVHTRGRSGRLVAMA